MPLTLQELYKKISKIKNKIIKSENYLQLEEAIKDFEKVKLQVCKVQSKQSSSEDSKKKKKQKEQQKEQDSEVRKLVQTCEQLIKEKIKYFKKIVIKKIDEAKKEKRQEAQLKKEKKNSQLNLFSNTSSQLNKSSPQLNKDYSSLLGSSDFKQLRQLQQSSKKFKKSPHHFDQTQQPQFSNSQTQFVQQPRKSPSHCQKRLKQSKSVDLLFDDKVKESFTFRNENSVKRSQKEDETYYSQAENRYEMDDDNKTQVKLFNRKNQPFNQFAYCQEQDLQFYKNKVAFLEQLIHSGSLNTNQMSSPLQNQIGQTSQIFNHFHFKLRQKSLELEQVKGRLIYYQTSNQQLKNRLQNQQRRNQDYINGLKEQIKAKDNTIYQSQKQKKLMSQLIKQLQFKMQVEQKQKLQYIQQIQSLLKQKQRSKLNDKSKADDLKKELQVMAKQQKCIKDLEVVIKEHKIQSQIMFEKNNQLQGEVTALKQDLKKFTEEKDMLEELLQLKLEEIQQFKVQVYQLKRQLTQVQDENKQIKEQLGKWQRQKQEEERKKEKIVKNKVEKLKQLKSLLAEDV